MAADLVTLGLRRHVEQTDIADAVVCWLRDLDEAWQAEQQR